MSIERRAVSALKWATTAKVVVQLVSWSCTLIVIRLLTPEDYGLMAKVGVVSGITSAIAELGLGGAIIRTPRIGRDDLRKILGLSILLGIAMTVAVAAASPLFARWFHEPSLAGPLAVSSLQILVSAFAVIPSAMASRELSFGLVSKVEMATGVATAAITVALAVAGAGVWALVIGNLAGALARSALLLLFSDRVWPRFSTEGIAEHIKFGLTLVGSRMSYFVVVQSDIVIGSAFLSTTEIGQYAVALQLATLPMSKMMGTINAVVMPAFSRKQGDSAAVREALRRSMSLLAMAAFPLLWGISAHARELVLVLFGPSWRDAVPALQILPLVVPFRMIFSVLLTTSLALGYRQLDARNTLANVLVIPAGFLIGVQFGLVGLCTSWLVAVPMVYTLTVPAAMKNTGLTVDDLLRTAGPPALAAAMMYGAVGMLRLFCADSIPPVALLAVLAGSSVLVYGAMLRVVSTKHYEVLFAFLRQLRSA
ncbi:MAG: lipopolysaccharide biosynthesis protein [Burkholderiaceae bacterium]